jgi:hypothetical protein
VPKIALVLSKRCDSNKGSSIGLRDQMCTIRARALGIKDYRKTITGYCNWRLDKEVNGQSWLHVDDVVHILLTMPADQVGCSECQATISIAGQIVIV